MKWNSLDIIKFLAIYEHFPILWNFKLKDVQNNQTKESEFSRLSEELRIAGLLGDMSEKQLKAKIKCIKDVLRQELTKVHKSMLTCVDPKDVYRPKLAWFDSAEFLRDIMSTTGGAKHSRLELHPQEKLEYIETEDLTPTKRSLDISPVSYASINRPLHKIKKLKTMLPSEIQINPLNLNDSASSSTSSSKNFEDVYDQFGKYIACELRSLPPREAILVKQEIQNIVTKVHLALCQPNPSNNFEYNPLPIDYVSPSYSHSSDSESCENTS